MDLTLGAALLAGLVSFLSPCVLPVVPAYLGQLGVLAVAAPTGLGSPSLAVAGSTGGAAVAASTPPRSGWRAMPNAFAFVLGFTMVFTVLGAGAYIAATPLRDNLPLLRVIGGVILVVFGLSLMGVLPIRALARSWKPLERFGGDGPGTQRTGVVGGFALGSIFAVGWTPCIGPTLGAILTLAAVGSSPQVVGLLVAYSIGLGLPFILMALAFDRAPLLTRPLVRYGRQVQLAGGALIVILGVALIFDWLSWLASTFSFLIPQQ